jgi:hypothetical protein
MLGAFLSCHLHPFLTYMRLRLDRGKAADANLQLIKIVTSKLPFDWGSKVESVLRIFGADRALLLIEGVAIAKVMLGFAYPFRRRR